MDKIVIIGGGGHAKVVAALLKKLGALEIFGYVDLRDRGELLGAPYLGPDEKLPEVRDAGVAHAVIGIGQLDDLEPRRRAVERALTLGFEFPALVSPTAIVNEDVKLGQGTVVMDGAVVQPGTTIGDFSILNTRCSVDHDCRIGSYVHLAPGVTLSGGVSVGDNCLVGTGATIIHSVNLVAGCVIGAGSTIFRDCTEPATYIGNPPRKVAATR